MRREIQPRYIRPESILLGDTIKTSWEWNDATHTITGTVAYRDNTLNATFWYTKGGIVLLMRNGQMHALNPEGSRIAKITLLAREITANEESVLF